MADSDRPSTRPARRRGVRVATRTVLLAACALTVAFYVTDLGGVGLWQGEPSVHLGKQLKAIESFHRAADEGRSRWSAFVEVYHVAPKVAADALNVGVGLLFFDETPSVRQQKELWSRILLTSFILTAVAYAIYFPRHFRLPYALVALLLLGTNTYIHLYAAFPRQNMTAHLLTFAAILALAHYRPRADHLPEPLAFVLGACVGLACLVHYSAIQVVTLVVVSEAALVPVDRRPWRSLIALGIFLAAVVSVWFTADLYYLAFTERATFNRSVLAGFVHTLGRLGGREMLWKLPPPEWWFGLGFLYRTANPLVWAFLPVGVSFAGWRLASSLRGRRLARPRLRLYVLGLVGIGLLLFSSVRYFAAARSLAHYLPLVALMTLVGLRAAAAAAQRRFGTRADLVVAGLAAASLLVSVPRLSESHRSIRGVAQANRWVAENDVRQMYTPRPISHPEPLLRAGLEKIGLRELRRVPPAGYVYTYRLARVQQSDPLVGWRKVLRDVEPVAVFAQYSGHPAYWYEFPLRSDVHDLDDPLVTSRRVYRVGDVQEALRRARSGGQ